jgi:hypothetical protein
MTRLIRTPSFRRPAPRFLIAAILLVMTAFPGAGASGTGGRDLPSGPARLADALADSIDALTARESVTVTDTREDGVRIDRGATGGLRPYSRLTLLVDGAPPWPADVSELKDAGAWLKPVAGVGPPPAAGSRARVRLDLARLALARPVTSGDVARRHADAWLARLAERLGERAALGAVTMPDLPDTSEWREVALGAGAEAGVHLTLSESDGQWTATASVGSLRRARDFGTARTTLRAPAEPTARPASAALPIEPPPGLVAATSVSLLDGAALDIVTRRWIWSDVLVILDDRIDAWRVGDGAPRVVRTTDLTATWPPVVHARWSVAEMLPVNTFFAMSGEEARVNYSLCSNRRPRFLTINVEKAAPESLTILVSDGPLDTLEASLGGCFRELDRVAVPAGWKADPAMPATAAARLAMEEILRDAAGRPLRTESGQLRRKKTAVIFHDEGTGTLWLASATTAGRIPGNFGGEMEEFRVGLAGPPGFLVTGDAAPGGPDHLEWWRWDEGRCERRWTGAAVEGSITALLAGDRDGDERDDLVLAVVNEGTDGFRTALHVISSRPRGGVTP